MSDNLEREQSLQLTAAESASAGQAGQKMDPIKKHV